MKVLAWVTGVLPLIGLAAETQAPVPGFTLVRSLDGIQEYRLDANGLQVLVKTDHAAPVATFSVVYRVGSRNEGTGTTGSTHLLEHLMFKGSDAFNDTRGNSVKQYLERVGGEYGASTSADRTNYFATVGSAALEGYIAIEADRMHNLWLRERDRQAEMTVVRNEYERGENSPLKTLTKEVSAAAYQALPYHHSTIGWRSDIENVPIEKLRTFYETFYWPNNATAIVVGDVQPAAVLATIKRYYGIWPQSPQPIPEMYTQEPEQAGARRVIVKRAGQLGNVLVAYKIPDARNPESAPLLVLQSIMNDGKGSRLYRALVDPGLALNAIAVGEGGLDLSLYVLGATLAPGAKHEQAEKALVAEIERVKSEGVTASEVAAAIRRYRATLALYRDGSAAVAAALGEAVASGDWTLYVSELQNVEKVTPSDVQRVARQYLNEDQSTTGWFVPIETEAEKS